jgi:hypothetical protein
MTYPSCTHTVLSNVVIGIRSAYCDFEAGSIVATNVGIKYGIIPLDQHKNHG